MASEWACEFLSLHLFLCQLQPLFTIDGESNWSKKNPRPHFTYGGKCREACWKIHLQDIKGTGALHAVSLGRLHASSCGIQGSDKCVGGINLWYCPNRSISSSRHCRWISRVLLGQSVLWPQIRRWQVWSHRSNRESERIWSDRHISKWWHWRTIV